MRLSVPLFDRWKSSWTYKLQKYRGGPRWSLPRFVANSTPFNSTKFRRPPSLTKWGLPQQTRPSRPPSSNSSSSSKSSSSSSKYCDMVRLHVVSGKHTASHSPHAMRGLVGPGP
ncbi:hypothetical protein Esti_001298 [Eimeria stiedai]